MKNKIKENKMKKSIIYTGVAAFVLAGAGFVVANTTQATGNNEALETLAVVSNAKIPAVPSKNETVYAITSLAGETNKVFVGSSLYTGNAELPVSLSISYYLDGKEVSASEIAGKSGHVKMVYSYNSLKQSGGKYVPFLAVTGMSLDSEKFSNVSLENGKIVSEKDNYLVVGYALPGVNEDLGTDLLPSEFVVEADAKDFELGDVYTFFSNDFFRDIDTSKLADLDSLRDSLNDLSEGLDQIISGSGVLTNGLSELVSGAKELQSGAETLAGGISSAAEGAKNLSDSLAYVTGTYNESLQAGALAVITSTLTELNTTISGNDALMAAITAYGIDFPISVDNYTESIPAIKKLAPLESLDTTKGLLDLSTGIIGYTTGVAQMAEGAGELSAGLEYMNSKTPELVAGLGSLVDGSTKLYEGSVTLHEGLDTFKNSGIDKLVNFANEDLAGFTRNARATVTAANSYRAFDSSAAESVKFIFKTPSLK